MKSFPLVDEVIALDTESRKAKQEADDLRASRNRISKEIGALMAQGKKEEAEAHKGRSNCRCNSLQNLKSRNQTYLQRSNGNHDGDS